MLGKWKLNLQKKKCKTFWMQRSCSLILFGLRRTKYGNSCTLHLNFEQKKARGSNWIRCTVLVAYAKLKYFSSFFFFLVQGKHLKSVACWIVHDYETDDFINYAKAWAIIERWESCCSYSSRKIRYLASWYFLTFGSSDGWTTCQDSSMPK